MWNDKVVYAQGQFIRRNRQAGFESIDNCGEGCGFAVVRMRIEVAKDKSYLQFALHHIGQYCNIIRRRVANNRSALNADGAAGRFQCYKKGYKATKCLWIFWNQVV